MDGRTDLHNSIHTHDVEEALDLIRCRSWQVDRQDELGKTPLHLAAERSGSPKLAKALISAGAPLDFQDKWGMTALHFASRKGHTEFADELIKAGALVNIHSRDVASYHYHTSIDYVGMTALHFAIENGHTRIVCKLLKAGASKKANNEDYGTVLSTIFGTQKPKRMPCLIRLLLHSGYTNQADKLWLNDMQNLPRELTRDPELLSWFLKQIDAVPTLRQSCRVSLRKHLGQISGTGYGESQIAELPIPSVLKNYLLFKDLDDEIRNNHEDEENGDDDDGEDFDDHLSY